MDQPWEYTVSPKLWDTDEQWIHMLNLAHEQLGYEFVGAVELQDWEHHVWRRPKPPLKKKALEGWTAVLTQVAETSGRKLGSRARRFLKQLERAERSPAVGEVAGGEEPGRKGKAERTGKAERAGKTKKVKAAKKARRPD